MLNIVCSIAAPNNLTERNTVQITPSISQELDLFSSTNFQKKIVNTKSCPCCQGRSISLVVGLIFSESKLILLDSPITYCLEEKSLYLSAEDLAVAQARLKNLISDDWQKLPPQWDSNKTTTGSIGIVEVMVGEEIRKTLQVSKEQELFYSPTVNVISCNAKVPTLHSKELSPDSVAFHAGELPKVMRLKFEPTTRCNFKCEFCYGRYLVQGDLTFDDFVNIIDRLDFVKAVELTGEGEPLLNNRLYDMLTLCNQRGIWTHITTNASLLTPARCRNLLATGLDSLAISMESFNPEQFEKIRLGSRYDQVIQGIRTIAQIRKERDKPLQIQLWITLLKNTISQIDEITKFAQEVGIDSLQFQSLNPMPAYMRFYPPYLQQNLLYLADIKNLYETPETDAALKTALSDIISWYQGKRCDIFMQSIMVNWQGLVTPCCFLKTPDFPHFGNINLDKLQSIWHQEDYRFFRFALQHGVVLNSCQGCPSVAAA